MTLWRTGRVPALRAVWFALAIVWLGGLTFYAAVVVPIGAQITSSITQGFVTQRVTVWLNVLGTVYLASTVGDAIERAGGRRRLWIVMAAAQLALWLLHAVLDQQLNPATLSVHDLEQFYGWHRLYLIATCISWMAGVGHVGATGLAHAGPIEAPRNAAQP